MNCLLDDDASPEEVHHGMLLLDETELREAADTLQAAMLAVGHQCSTTIDLGLPPSLTLAVKRLFARCVSKSRTPEGS